MVCRHSSKSILPSSFKNHAARLVYETGPCFKILSVS